ncbi:MAG: hypothetical protein PHW33_00040 [Candidatus Portnoybacteria bacterium]|jgi:hypothetical protein|nr:hypothetical protein [Candidatus Portnoybacteria bacterium]
MEMPRNLVVANNGLTEAYRNTIAGLEAIIAGNSSSRFLTRLEKLLTEMKKNLGKLEINAKKLSAPSR